MLCLHLPCSWGPEFVLELVPRTSCVSGLYSAFRPTVSSWTESPLPRGAAVLRSACMLCRLAWLGTQCLGPAWWRPRLASGTTKTSVAAPRKSLVCAPCRPACSADTLLRRGLAIALSVGTIFATPALTVVPRVRLPPWPWADDTLLKPLHSSQNWDPPLLGNNAPDNLQASSPTPPAKYLLQLHCDSTFATSPSVSDISFESGVLLSSFSALLLLFLTALLFSTGFASASWLSAALSTALPARWEELPWGAPPEPVVSENTSVGSARNCLPAPSFSEGCCTSSLPLPTVGGSSKRRCGFDGAVPPRLTESAGFHSLGIHLVLTTNPVESAKAENCSRTRLSLCDCALPLSYATAAVMLSVNTNNRCPKFVLFLKKCLTAYKEALASKTGMLSARNHLKRPTTCQWRSTASKPTVL